jgi:glycosyltransferase involved in cell wall biosynthesis
VVDILVFPSLFEGFGMPIIEAQAMGTPVLTSNLSSMPEVAGDGALLVNPYSVNDIKDGVLKLIEDSSYRSRLIENGFRNCQKFNSKEIANQYYELYKQF